MKLYSVLVVLVSFLQLDLGYMQGTCIAFDGFNLNWSSAMVDIHLGVN